MDYLTLKFVHVLAAIVLLGTGFGSAWYLWMTVRSRNLQALRLATRLVVIADWWFTTPAVVLQLLTGVAMVHSAGHSFTDTWILLGLILYLFAGLCWIPVVWLQIRMRDLAREAGEELDPQWWRYYHRWMVLGCLAFPAVLLVVWLMVNKPL